MKKRYEAYEFINGVRHWYTFFDAELRREWVNNKPDKRGPKKYYYAYEITSSAQNFYAFFDRPSRQEWIDENPCNRWPAHRADLTRPQIKEALWWTENPIGAAISAHSAQK